MEKTVIQVGNSLAITLPSEYVKAKKIKAGQKVYIDANQALDFVQIRTTGGATSGLTPEFFEWLNRFNKKYKNALTELAKK